MTLEEFINLLERIHKGEQPSVPSTLQDGIRMLSQTTPQDDSRSDARFGLWPWAHFFRQVAHAPYPKEAQS